MVIPNFHLRLSCEKCDLIGAGCCLSYIKLYKNSLWQPFLTRDLPTSRGGGDRDKHLLIVLALFQIAAGRNLPTFIKGLRAHTHVESNFRLFPIKAHSASEVFALTASRNRSLFNRWEHLTIHQTGSFTKSYSERE